MAIVYRHLKPNGEVFYIGIAKSMKRVRNQSSRSIFWKKVVAKYGYEIQILTSNVNYEQAKELEKMLIAHYGRRNLGTGTLVNLTDGGEGTSGAVVTEELKMKRLLNRSGKTKKKVICLENGKIWETIADCSREMGYDSRFLSVSLNYSKDFRINDINIEFLSLYEEGKTRPNSKKVGKASGARNKNSIKIIDTKTLEVYDSIFIASKAIGMSYSRLSCMVSNKNYNTTDMVYYKDYLNNTIPNKKENKLNKKVINKENGEIYNSAKKASEACNMNYNTFTSKINGKRPNTTTFEYLTNI